MRSSFHHRTYRRFNQKSHLGERWVGEKGVRDRVSGENMGKQSSLQVSWVGYLRVFRWDFCSTFVNIWWKKSLAWVGLWCFFSGQSGIYLKQFWLGRAGRGDGQVVKYVRVNEASCSIHWFFLRKWMVIWSLSFLNQRCVHVAKKRGSKLEIYTDTKGWCSIVSGLFAVQEKEIQLIKKVGSFQILSTQSNPSD